MKIFSWVHRRFRPKTMPDDHEDAADNDKAALLEHKLAFASACDAWKEGILAIGTLGSTDLFNDFYLKDVEEETFVNNQVLFFGSEDDEEEGEMECPLVLKASKHGFDHDVQKQDLSPFAKPNSGIQEDVGMTKLDLMDLDIQGTKTKIRKSGERRITLADLLWADSEKNLLKNKLPDDHFKNPNDDGTTDTKFIKSFFISKKKKKLDKDDSSDHPIKKTKRLMRKMLKKKKIHPDTGIQKKETVEMDVHAI